MFQQKVFLQSNSNICLTQKNCCYEKKIKNNFTITNDGVIHFV